MSLKAKATADEFGKLDPAIQALYVKAGDGSFTLDVEENGQLRTALATERQARERAEKDSRDLQAALDKFKDIKDPQLALDALKQLEQLDTEKLLKAGKLDEVIKMATSKVTEAKDAEIKLALGKVTDADAVARRAAAYAKRMALEREVAVVASTAKVRPSAIADVVTRAASVWQLEGESEADMKLVPYADAEKKQLLFGKTPPKPVEMVEWITGLEKDFPHYFEGSTGSGKPPIGGRLSQGSQVTLTREEARDPMRYRASKEQADKAGVPLQIVEQ